MGRGSGSGVASIGGADSIGGGDGVVGGDIEGVDGSSAGGSIVCVLW